MKKLFVLIILSLFMSPIAFATAKSSFKFVDDKNFLQGFWEGEIVREGKIWRVNFDIKRDGARYKALADFIDVDGYEREFSVAQRGENFRLERP